jgi:transcriptional regulator with XRE-family HTH domain
MYNISKNIKKIRELKGITREQLASDLGMSVSGYSKIERGEVNLSLSKTQKISELLGVDISKTLHFDATQIFNEQNINLVQGISDEDVFMDSPIDDYKDKYIKMLEKEVERLNSRLESRGQI